MNPLRKSNHENQTPYLLVRLYRPRAEILDGKDADGSVTIQFGGCDGCELHTDNARLELLGALLSPPQGNPRWHVEVS